MVMTMIPFLLFAMYEKNGRPFELVARDMINVIFIKPKQRPYKTQNYYSMLMKQNKLDREVKTNVERQKQSTGKPVK